MRRASKIDANQNEIVEALRAVGCTVQSLAFAGKGVPDLLVGTDEGNLLLEVKDGSLAPSARRLTPDQVQWHANWRGRVHVVTSIAEALAVVGVSIGHEATA
jgi:Holliday junction resolvase